MERSWVRLLFRNRDLYAGNGDSKPHRPGQGGASMSTLARGVCPLLFVMTRV